MTLFTRTISSVLLVLAVLISTAQSQAERLNVLFIAVDDLRCELGAYGSPFIKTPNMDRLAEEGSLFDQTYCQIPLCGPSRVSLMTGQYPEKVNLFENKKPWRKENRDVVTLPQHFKNEGYTAVAAGKLYHNGRTHQDPASWSDPTVAHWRNGLSADYRNPESLASIAEVEKKAGESGGSSNVYIDSLAVLPPFEKQVVEDEETTDGKIAQIGIDYLREFKDTSQPFFLALGFHKPHLSFNAPEKYWDLYDSDELPPPPNPVKPEDYFQWSYNSSYIRKYKGMPKSGEFPEETAKTLRHAYFASVSFVDAQIGKVLDELKRLGLDQNTIVVLWGDHGYLLNDHGVFGKHNHFELALRTPLIISAPGIDHAARVTGPTELVDIYPTVCELAGITVPEDVQGKSQVMALQNGQSMRQTAYAVYGNPDKILGRSIRTSRYRYIEWAREGESFYRALFDYATDPIESRNLVDDKSYNKAVEALEKALNQRTAAAKQ